MDARYDPLDLDDAVAVGRAGGAHLTDEAPHAARPTGGTPGGPDRTGGAPATGGEDTWGDDRPATPPVERWVSGKRVAVATATSLVLMVVPVAALGLQMPLDTDIAMIVMLALSGLAAIAGTWAAVRWPHPTTWAAVGVRPASRGWLALGVALGLGTMLLNFGTAALYGAVTGDQTVPAERVAMVEVLTGPLWQSLVMLFLGGLLVPLGEELIFRGVVFGWLRRWPLSIAVIVSALVFAVMHGFSVVFPVALVLGLVTAVVYHRSGSIWPAVAIHAVNNSVAFVIALLSQ